MRLEKSSIGYKLIKKQKTDNSANDGSIQFSESQIAFVAGLLKRLRNLFLSVTPSDYCAITLSGAPDFSMELDPDSQLEGIVLKPLEYLGEEIGAIKYHLYTQIDSKDEAKIQMLTDLFGYLIYYHQLMYEYITIE